MSDAIVYDNFKHKSPLQKRAESGAFFLLLKTVDESERVVDPTLNVLEVRLHADRLVCEREPVPSVGIYAHLERDLIFRERVRKHERVLHGHRRVGYGVPEEHRHGALVDVLFDRNIVDDGGVRVFGIFHSEQVIYRAAVRVFAARDDGVAHHDTAHFVVSVRHIDLVVDALSVPHCAEHAGKVAARRKADREHEIGVDAESFRIVLDDLDGAARVDERVRIFRVRRDGIVEHERVIPASEERHRHRLALAVGTESVRAAGDNEYRLALFVERQLFRSARAVAHEFDVRILRTEIDYFGFHKSHDNVLFFRFVQ